MPSLQSVIGIREIAGPPGGGKISTAHAEDRPVHKHLHRHLKTDQPALGGFGLRRIEIAARQILA